MIKKLLLIAMAVMAIASVVNAAGANTFKAEGFLTNSAFGTSATFGIEVWYRNVGTGTNDQLLRIDYTDITGTRFMQEVYNYQTNDRYQICPNTNCERATFTPDVPLFFTNNGGQTCVDDQFNGAENTCGGAPASCRDPGDGDKGIRQLQFNSGGSLCRAIWSRGDNTNNIGNVFHFRTYSPNGDGSGNVNTYTNVFSNKNCPEPTCFARLEIALIVDESGSIDDDEWVQQTNFIKQLVNAFDISPNDVRVGLAYFSGFSGGTINRLNGVESQCGSSNARCRCRYDFEIASPSGSKSDVLAAINRHDQRGGFTCGAGGVEAATRILSTGVRPGIPRAMIFVTDGEFNRWTDFLQNRVDALYALANPSGAGEITVAAVGVDGFQIDQLRVLTRNDDSQIYSVSNFDQLQSLLAGLFNQFCEPLPPTACQCNGVCACAATCKCPSCGVDDECTVTKCDATTRGVCASNPVTCNDNNQCTDDSCNPATGCVYTPIARPAGTPADNFCVEQVCQNGDFVPSVVGNAKCNSVTGCVIRYCDPDAGECGEINRNTLRTDQSVTYTRFDGQQRTVSGCAAPPGAKSCQVFSCINGKCDVDNSNCECLTKKDCNTPANGCYDRNCTDAGTCVVESVIDCIAEVSNGTCTKNTADFTPNDADARALFYGTGATGNYNENNGIPVIGVSRDCNQVACFNGQRSTYTCESRGANSHVCRRTAVSCTSPLCDQDNICRADGQVTSTGVGTINEIAQVPSSCVARNIDCSDNDACTVNERCDSTKPRTDDNARCISDARICNPSDACNIPSCNNVTGCVNTPKDVTGDTTCLTFNCNPATGVDIPSLKPLTGCSTTTPDDCIVQYCAEGTGCQEINRTALDFGTTVQYTDALGATFTVSACRPQSASDCIIYTCLPDGGCSRDFANCDCDFNATSPNEACDDNNGCTIDTCLANNTCSYEERDCFADLSNNGCIQGGTFGETGTDKQFAFATTNATVPPEYNEGVGNLPMEGITRTCNDLACFRNERSTYRCRSTSNSTSVCVRELIECTSDGCVDNICTASGVWSNAALADNTLKQPITRCDRRDFLCNDGDPCTLNDRCNVTADPKSGTAGRCFGDRLPNNCDDNDACTVDACTPQGCTNDDIPRPIDTPADTFCFVFRCNPATGIWDRQDNANDRCTPSTNKCTTNRCTNQNGVNGVCTVNNAAEFAFNVNTQLTDSSGNSVALTGCMKPSTALPCIDYICNTTTGACETDDSRCVCQNDNDCNDNDGCTIDTCDTVNNVCVYTPIDCINRLSNGVCDPSQPITPTNEPARTIFYQGGATTVANGRDPDVNGEIPIVDRTCAELACYRGEHSIYKCSSTGDRTFQCRRTINTAIFNGCQADGCTDRLCRVDGGPNSTYSTVDQITIGNNTVTRVETQITTSCEVSDVICSDADPCTINVCDSLWNATTQTVSERCPFPQINCNDENNCTRDFCDPTDTQGDNGNNTFLCRNVPFTQEELFANNICAPVDCAEVTCVNSECQQNTLVCPTSTSCVAFLCNGTSIENTTFANSTFRDRELKDQSEFCLPVIIPGNTVDECGVCNGDGLTCRVAPVGTPVEGSAAVAAGVAGGVIGLAALAAGIFAAKKGVDKYQAIAAEGTGAVSDNKAYLANEGGQNIGAIGADDMIV